MNFRHKIRCGKVFPKDFCMSQLTIFDLDALFLELLQLVPARGHTAALLSILFPLLQYFRFQLLDKKTVSFLELLNIMCAFKLNH